jgi:hypothetical protein
MRVEQRTWTRDRAWATAPGHRRLDDAQLVLVFASGPMLARADLFADLRRDYPRAQIVGCSTAGEIADTRVTDDTLVSTAVAFEHTTIQLLHGTLASAGESYAVGARLAGALEPKGLVHAFVLYDGQIVNGSELVKGMAEHLPPGVVLTGGLAGDGARFKETFVVWNGEPLRNAVVAIGFHGERLEVGYASLGGWDAFGPLRRVTKSSGNVLYEMDGKSALGIYKNYLGPHAEGLPATGLLFPLMLREVGKTDGVVRTILAVNEDAQSMTFAGDVPEGAHVQLMKANFDRLIDGAVGAARISQRAAGAEAPELAILISCVGRKMVLGQRIEEEVEGVREVLGARPTLTGFYSYGEISPFTPNATCELHNQTMTITTLREA